MEAYLVTFGSMLLRWLHVIAAMAWIGESFHFVMLDKGLRSPRDADDRRRGVFGEMWAVHGGGFYHNQKYVTAPAKLPEHLHWSFWQAYTTWLSGFALFAVMYLSQPSLYLLNRSSDWRWAAGMSGWQVGLVAVVFLLLGWLVYDQLCKRISPSMKRDGLLTIAVAVMMIVVAWLSTQIFSGRAAFLITGAVMATAMAGNVFFCIIPGQRRMVAAMKAGREPDPLDGQRGRQRSVHNTYFTLPVVFLMLSNHYAFMYTHAHAWLIMVMFIFAGALIREFFVLMHAGALRPWYAALGTAIILGVAWIAWPVTASRAPAARASATPASVERSARPADLNQVASILEQRCTECHSHHPTEAGFTVAPNNIFLDDKESIVQRQSKIKQVVANRYMPLGNITKMTDDERAVIAAWPDPAPTPPGKKNGLRPDADGPN